MSAAKPPLRLAVVGAGPVGLALALLAAERLPEAQITLHDARDLSHDVSGDPRTLALALGSVQLLQRLNAWPHEEAALIQAVHVSEQAAPKLFHWSGASTGQPAVRIDAATQGVAFLGAVLPHGRIVAPLQREWLKRCEAEPLRLHSRFGKPVRGFSASARAGAVVVVVDDHSAESGQAVEDADLIVVAEGGVFGSQARKAVSHDYQQTAWVGTVQLQGAESGTAFERFTRHGPVALLPLPLPPPGAGSVLPTGVRRASLVWCTDARDDPVATLSDAQRRVVLASMLPPEAGRVVDLSPLKRFPLGLNAERTLVSGPHGRVVRIGNAAQTLHPVAGQGLNLGLRDAYELVEQLQRSPPDVAAALRRVEWQRAPDRWALIATTDFLARSFTWELPGVALLRSVGLAALQSAPPLKRIVAKQFMFGSR